jgi:hypothetical protein
LLLPLQASLAAGQETATDVVKVFATTTTTNFRWLELPALDHPIAPQWRTRGGPSSALDALLAAVLDQRPQTRALNTAAFAGADWATAQVEVLVKSA